VGGRRTVDLALDVNGPQSSDAGFVQPFSALPA